MVRKSSVSRGRGTCEREDGGHPVVERVLHEVALVAGARLQPQQPVPGRPRQRAARQVLPRHVLHAHAPAAHARPPQQPLSLTRTAVAHSPLKAGREHHHRSPVNPHSHMQYHRMWKCRSSVQHASLCSGQAIAGGIAAKLCTFPVFATSSESMHQWSTPSSI